MSDVQSQKGLMASCPITAFHATLENTEAFYLLSIREKNKTTNQKVQLIIKIFMEKLIVIALHGLVVLHVVPFNSNRL